MTNDKEHDQELREAFDLGEFFAKAGDVAGAQAAYQRAIDSGHAEWAPRAAFNLGELLAGQKSDVLHKSEISFVDAEAAYQRAIDSRHAEWAPRAALSLGAILAFQGDVDRAESLYRWVINSHPKWASSAADSLSFLRPRYKPH